MHFALKVRNRMPDLQLHLLQKNQVMGSFMSQKTDSMIFFIDYSSQNFFL